MRLAILSFLRSGALAALAVSAILSIAASPSALADEAAGAVQPAAAADPVASTPQDSCKPCYCDPPPAGCPCPCSCIPDTLLCIPCFDKCIDSYEKAKADSCFKLSAGAYHWFNYNFDTEKLNYGSPSAEGTYFYYFDADLDCTTCNPCVTWGMHTELRARDQSTFRTFFKDEVWFYELYGWLEETVDACKDVAQVISEIVIKGT